LTAPTLRFVERDVVRLVVLDANGRVLLLQSRDLGNPEFGTAWELPGGGLEPDESHADAAVRELHEETGIAITRDEVSAPTWRRDVRYVYRGMDRLQHERISVVRLQVAAPEIESSHLVDTERDDLFGSRWWNIEEIVGGSERFYPRSLPSLLRHFLAGGEITEPEERWP
jgi:8-oxo-dGTP pyrophosphatase MutT (NUDIX family)